MKGKLAALVPALLALLGGVARADIVNVASEAGISEKTRTFSLSTTDYNRDGKRDFFLVRHDPQDLGAHIPPSTLYRGTGSRFQATPPSFQVNGKNTDKHGCDWSDVNLDGRSDMFCAIGLTQFSKNELWVQGADGSFTNQAQERGLYVGARGRYRYATFIHANNDARPDIYVTRYTGSCYCDRNGDGIIDYTGDEFPNELWINEGQSFRRAPEFGLDRAIGAKKDNATCAQAVDYDRDGDEDLLVCAAKQLHLYENNGGTRFTDVTSDKGVGLNAQDARLVDVSEDGRRDLVTLTRGQVTVRYGDGAGGFGPAVVLADLTGGEALAFGRFNAGPTTDVYVLASRGGDRFDDPDKILLQRSDGTWDALVVGSASGSGDDVVAIDYNDDGRHDFIVTNGDRKRYGPVQLFTWRR